MLKLNNEIGTSLCKLKRLPTSYLAEAVEGRVKEDCSSLATYILSQTGERGRQTGSADLPTLMQQLDPKARGTIESQWKTLRGITPDRMRVGTYNFRGR